MKSPLCFSCVLVACLLALPARAATLVLDTFSEGSFQLSNTGADTQTDNIISPAASYRNAFGYGVDRWSAGLPAGSGVFTYATRSLVPTGAYFHLSYSRPPGGVTSLLATEAFVLKVSALVGEAYVVAFQGVGPGAVLPVTLSTTGDLVIPIDNLTQRFPVNLDRALVFGFYPTTGVFSVALDEIDLVVPEPSSAGLAASGIFLLLQKRRRAEALAKSSS